MIEALTDRLAAIVGLGLNVALPDGSVLRRHSEVRSDNTGYDLASVFVGAEGTLGVITGLDLRLHPTPTQRITAIAGFDDLDALIDVGREFRDADGIAALELIDARASALTAEHMGVGPAVDGAWQLLIELAVGVDTATQHRLWQVREAVADVLGIMVHH
jgi:FAD/FMN-containing dehydrogenase